MPNSANGASNPLSESLFQGDPRLFVGKRASNKRLVALRLELHQDSFAELADSCKPALSILNTATSRDYVPFGEIERGEEYFSMQISDLPNHSGLGHAGTDDSGTPEGDTADLVNIVRDVDALEIATSQILGQGKYSFYGICWRREDEMIGFVTRADPVVTVQRGMRFFQYGRTLKKTVRPDIAIKDGCDLVVTGSTIAVLRTSAVASLLGDVGVLFESVQEHATRLASSLTASLPLSERTLEAILTEAGRLVSLAKRLRFLPDRVEALDNLNAAVVRDSMLKHELDPDRLLSAQDQFDFGTEVVPLFFDVLEGRFFEDDLTQEHRRADRYTPRSS